MRTIEVHLGPVADARWPVEGFVRRLLHRPHESDFKALTYYRPSRPVVIDGGANHGQSIDAFQIVLDRPFVRAFEPNRQLCQALVRRNRANSSIEVSNTALGAVAGEMVLYIPKYDKHIFDGLASLTESDALVLLPHVVYNFDESKVDILKQPCRVITLDSLKLSPDIIKLDLQGYELAALLGARQTLRQSEPILLIEAPGPDIHDLLDGLGYEPLYFDGNKLRREVRPVLNTFFVTAARNHEFGKMLSPRV